MSGYRHEPESLKSALAAAEQMRASGQDPDNIAHWLLSSHSRCQTLEDLLVVTERYLHFGMPEHELSEMRILVERLREQDLAREDGDEVESTLPL